MGLLRRHWLLSAIVVSVLLTYLVPYATDYLDDPADTLQNQCEKEDQSNLPRHIARPAHPGGVLKIRLTNDGAFVDRCEFSDVLYELNWNTRGAVGPPRKPDARSLPKFVVLYIHGWKHSGEDDDYANFKGLIERLANESSNADNKQLLGVYVDWNAKSKVLPLDRFPFDNLTFWSKQRVADRIAQSGVTTKIISAIDSVLSEGDDPAANQFITIGHSFGARLLFSATNQSLIYDTEKVHPGFRGGHYRKVNGIANMVILLNPAFEAARYTVLESLARAREHFADDQPPLLLSVSSGGDWATQIFFPLGQLLDHYRSPPMKKPFSLGQLLGHYSSGPEITTLGNYPEYQTHSLVRHGSPACGLLTETHLSERFVADRLCLVRDQVRYNGRTVQHQNPFLIARTDKSIIRGHTDTWNPTFLNWLFAYVNELGNRPRPRLLDNEAQEAQDWSSAAKPAMPGRSTSLAIPLGRPSGI
jgi:hypothetical protein